jgi:hypothetical protein
MGSASPHINVVCACGHGFKVHHSNVKGGEAIKCPACAKPMVCDPASDNPSVRKALKAARQFRLTGGEHSQSKPAIRF